MCVIYGSSVFIGLYPNASSKPWSQSPGKHSSVNVEKRPVTHEVFHVLIQPSHIIAHSDGHKLCQAL